MRFIGLFLVLGSAVGVSLFQDALGVVIRPVYFVGVLLAVFGSSLMAYGLRTTVAACVSYWGRCEKTPAEYALYAAVHETARKTSIAAGILGMLIGTAATLGAAAPATPDVTLFASSFAAPVFGIFSAYLWHEPMAAWFRNRASN